MELFHFITQIVMFSIGVYAMWSKDSDEYTKVIGNVWLVGSILYGAIV